MEPEDNFYLEIDDKFHITADSRQFILRSRRVAEKDTKTLNKGDIVKTTEGFYPTLKAALRAYKEKTIRNARIKSWEDLREVLLEIDKTLKSIGEKLDI